MRKKISTFIGLGFLAAILGLAFQNCAEQLPLIPEISENHQSSTSQVPAAVVSDIDAAPTDAKQTLESMMSLLDLQAADLTMAEVNSEVNYRRNLLVPQSDITLLNSPSIIAITSLAGAVCKQAVNKDKKATTKTLFTKIDFTKGPKSYGKAGALASYSDLAERFWARKPSSEEVQIFTEAVDEYYSSLDATALEKAAESDKLAIFICTGLLASPDSYLL